jgi:hypothetical protein
MINVVLVLQTVQLKNRNNNAMYTELAAVPKSLYHVTRANRVIASVRPSSHKERQDRYESSMPEVLQSNGTWSNPGR